MHLTGSIRQWWRGRSSRRQFDALDRATIAELARDNAIPETVLYRLALRGDTEPPPLHRLLERKGIDPDQLGRRHISVMRNMVGICAECPMTRRCRRDLNRQGIRAAHEQYCPNTETIEALHQGSDPLS
ncbi:conserved hypothetical protein [Hyphomicrobiales bacterium]|nr:conserved hypothetical protein [Hyphomicrobiales bacterium]CAH1698854.1 conserved hypothetical protein [Hyphomicrobiales bacterium]CAI0342498.1 conserved hypothetical protein [Hyphomicrobiales bacterium]